MGVTFVGIPFYTLAKYRAMGDAVSNLRKAGVVQRIKSVDNDLVDLGDVDCPSIVRDHGPKNLRNFEEFSEGTRRVKDKLTGLVDPSRITFCLGEDETLQSSVKLFPAKEIKKRGLGEIAVQMARFLSDSSDWIVAHLDVDVFDPSIMPGVDFPEPGGLTDHDVLEIFQALQSTGKVRVVDLTAYNPTLDKGGRGRSLLLNLIPRLMSHA